MGSSPSGGIPGWNSSIGSGPSRSGRRPRYGRSVAWAVAFWVVAVAGVYLISQAGYPQLGGWLGLAGFVFGIWFGGTMSRMTGSREWAVLTAILVAVAFLALGLGSCVYAMALYG
jgi:hypothetical protein